MLLSKKKRIELLGFDDFWFIIIGILILSLVVDFLINNSFGRLPINEALMNWSISLFFSTFNWFIIRGVLLYLRSKFPLFKDNAKRISLFLVLLILTILAVDFIGNSILESYFGNAFHRVSRSKIVLPVILISVMTMAIYEAIYYYIRLKTSIREEEQAKRVIVQAQLDALRNQAQPHFLFNSLNTLRDIIDQNPKEDAKKFVDKLSNVYRFILEYGSANLISIREELKFAHSYMHIQSERFGNNLQTEWDIPESYMDKFIVPMSMQLLLENAIKHNIISRAKPLHVKIYIQNNQLVVSNNIQSKSTKIASTKLGLTNIKKRYLLISDKAPEVKEHGNTFTVGLPLLDATDNRLK